jgi:hypothetical protein
MRPLGAICTKREVVSDPECVRKDGVLTGKSYGNGSLREPLQVGKTVLSGHDTDTVHTLRQWHARGIR